MVPGNSANAEKLGTAMQELGALWGNSSAEEEPVGIPDCNLLKQRQLQMDDGCRSSSVLGMIPDTLYLNVKCSRISGETAHVSARRTGGDIGELYSCKTLTIGELLSRRNPPIEVPEWQRGFSWGTVEVECFWLDLLAFASRREGAVAQDADYSFGPIVLGLQLQSRILLDGQHRLALAVIVLSAIRDRIRDSDPDTAADLQDNYIVCRDAATGAMVYSLTLNRTDREFFRREVQDDDPAGRRAGEPKVESHQLIWSARKRICERVEHQWVIRGGGRQALDWAKGIARILLDHVSVKASASLWSPSLRLPRARSVPPHTSAAESLAASRGA
jgi:hypothetical protein